MLGMENHSYAIVLDVPHYSLSYAIDVVSIHPIIGCELWIGALLAVLYRGVCSKDAIVVMLFLDYDAIWGCHPFKGMFSFKGLFS